MLKERLARVRARTKPDLKETAILVDLTDKTKENEKQTQKLIEGTKTLDKYPLNEPYAYARIVRDPIRGNITYLVQEPELHDEDQVHLKRLRELRARSLVLHEPVRTQS